MIIAADYECEVCGSIEEFTKKTVKEDWPKEHVCPRCNSKMTRIYSLGNIHIPEHMKATSTVDKPLFKYANPYSGRKGNI